VILRTSRTLLRIVGFAAFVFFVAILGLGLRLSAGPISLDFLKGNVETALSEGDGGYQLRMDRLLLTWDGVAGGLGFSAIGARITDGDGGRIGEVPKATMGLSFRAMLHGVLAPTRIRVEQPVFHLLRRLGTSQTQAGQVAAEVEEATLAGLVAGLLGRGLHGTSAASHPLGYLSEFRLIGASITIDDQVLEASWHLPRMDLALYRDEEGISGDYAAEIELFGKRARFTGDIHYPYAVGKLRVGIDFHEIEPAMFAIEATPLSYLSGLKIPLSGSIGLSLFKDGRLDEATLDLSSGKGRLFIPDVYDKGLEITFAKLNGTISGGLEKFVIEEFFVDLGGPTVKVSLRENREGEKLFLNGDVEILSMPIDDLPRYWPLGFSDNTREWIDEQLSFGTLKETRAIFSAVIDLEKGPSFEITELKGTIAYSGIDTIYMSDFPAVVGAGGTGTFDLATLHLALTQGTHEGLVLAKGGVHIFDLESEDPYARVDVTVAGPVRRALELLDHQKLRYLEKMELSPDRFEGEALIHLFLEFPLLADLAFEAIEIGADATLQALSFKDAIPGVNLRKGEVHLKLEGSSISMTGHGEVGGVPAKITWKENFSGKAAFQSRYTLKARMDDAARQRFGYSGAPFLSGPTEVALVYTSRDDKGQLAIDLDLASAELRVPGFEWTKPVGAPGKGTIQIDFDKGRLRKIRELVMTADGLDVKGEIDFALDGKTIEWVRFERLKFGLTDVEGKVARAADGGFDVTLTGRSFDAKKILEQDEEESEMDLPPLRLSVAVDAVRLGPGSGEKINHLEGTLQYDGKFWNSIRLDGVLEKRGTLKIVVQPGKDTRLLTVTSDAGGAVLEALGIMRNLHGGSLVISGVFHDNEKPDMPLRGRIKMKNFHAINAPVLAKVLVVASLTGILDLLKDKGVQFTRLDVPFTITPSEIHLDQGRAFGASLGITFAGRIDKVKDALDIRGTIVPAYTINRILGEIPIIGNILIGGKGEGVFAITYKAEGSREDPKVSVNLLSALAPGFLRKFFDVFEEEVKTILSPAPSPSTAPPPETEAKP